MKSGGKSILFSPSLLLPLCLEDPLLQICELAQGAKNLREPPITGQKNWKKESLGAERVGEMTCTEGWPELVI